MWTSSKVVSKIVLVARVCTEQKVIGKCFTFTQCSDGGDSGKTKYRNEMLFIKVCLDNG